MQGDYWVDVSKMWGLYRVNIGLTWGLYYWVKAGMGKGRVKKK